MSPWSPVCVLLIVVLFSFYYYYYFVIILSLLILENLIRHKYVDYVPAT